VSVAKTGNFLVFLKTITIVNRQKPHIKSYSRKVAIPASTSHVGPYDPGQAGTTTLL
jgi:hypothetical protein